MAHQWSHYWALGNTRNYCRRWGEAFGYCRRNCHLHTWPLQCNAWFEQNTTFSISSGERNDKPLFFSFLMIYLSYALCVSYSNECLRTSCLSRSAGVNFMCQPSPSWVFQKNVCGWIQPRSKWWQKDLSQIHLSSSSVSLDLSVLIVISFMTWLPPMAPSQLILLTSYLNPFCFLGCLKLTRS